MKYKGMITLLTTRGFHLENGFYIHKVENSTIPLELRVNFKTGVVIFFSTDLKYDVSDRLKKLEKVMILRGLGIDKLVEWEDDDSDEEKSKELVAEKSLAEEMIERYGENAQLDIVVEELSELTKECIKYKRTKTHGEPYDINHMAEELADAYVVCDIVQAILNNYGITKDKIQEIVNYKKERTRHRYLDNK